MKWYRNKQMLQDILNQYKKRDSLQAKDMVNLILDHLELLDENERLKKHNGRLTRKIQNLYNERATLICDLSLLRSNNEALLKLIGGIGGDKK